MEFSTTRVSNTHKPPSTLVLRGEEEAGAPPSTTIATSEEMCLLITQRDAAEMGQSMRPQTENASMKPCLRREKEALGPSKRGPVRRTKAKAQRSALWLHWLQKRKAKSLRDGKPKNARRQQRTADGFCVSVHLVLSPEQECHFDILKSYST